MSDSLLERFGAFARAQRSTDAASETPQVANAGGEFSVALLVAQVLTPELDESVTRTGLDELLAQIDAQQSPWDNLQRLGFRGNQADYQAPYNSAIDQVLSRRTGIPITLAVVLIETARALGQTAGGVNHPGHFLVRIEERLIDPFALAPLLEEPPAARAMPLISPLEMGLRMLNNLKYGYVRERVWHEALTLVSYQLALVPDHPQLLCEKGDFWAELGGLSSATAAYRSALAQCEGTQAASAAKLHGQISERLQRLAFAGSETLH